MILLSLIHGFSTTFGNTLWDEFFRSTKERADAEVCVPRLNAYEEGDRFIVEVFLPGVCPNCIVIQRTNQTITIKSKTEDKAKSKKDETNKRYYLRKENWLETFERNISIPSYVDMNSKKATFKNGVLRIEFNIKPDLKEEIAIQ